MLGMSLTLRIIIVVVVLLVAALVILTVFGVKIGDIGAQISVWLGYTKEAPKGGCETMEADDPNCNIFRGCQPCNTSGIKKCVPIGQCIDKQTKKEVNS